VAAFPSCCRRPNPSDADKRDFVVKSTPILFYKISRGVRAYIERVVVFSSTHECASLVPQHNKVVVVEEIEIEIERWRDREMR